MKKGVIAFAICLILFSSFAVASFSYKGENVKRNYYGGETISGTINLSLSSEPATNSLTSNFNGSIKLIDFLKRNGLSEGQDYSCSTFGCEEDYADKGTTNQISIATGEKKVFGFKITDNNPEVAFLNFSLTSTASASCGQQIKLTFLGNGMAMQNYKYGNNPCSGILRGCFNNGLGEGYDYPAVLSSTPICEKINLPVAAAYYIGANLTNSDSGVSRIRMQIVSNESWEPLAQCDLPQMDSSNQQLGCIVNYSSMSNRDYFICISADSPSNYKIRTEKSGDICGTSSGSYSYQKDYDLFAQALPFESVSIEVNRENFLKFNNGDLIEEIYGYLGERYEGNCTKGCFIPFEVTGISQNIDFANIKMQYRSNGQLSEINNLYLLETNPAKVSMSAKSLELRNADFVIPISTNENRLKLYLGGNKIGNDIILNVTSGFSFDVSPKFVLPGVEINFSIILAGNISSAKWEFGDNTTLQTSGKSVLHKYTSTGNYRMKVQVNTPSKTSILEFDISVGNPKEAARLLISQGESRINNITKEIESYPSWISQNIKDKLNVSDLQAQLTRIKNDYNTSSTDEQYIEQVSKLQSLQIPYSVSTVSSGVLPLIAMQDKIDSSYLLSLSGDSGEFNSNSFKKAVALWESSNYQSEIDFKKISAFRDAGTSGIYTLVKVKLKPVKTITDSAYLIIGYPINAIKFASLYGEKSVDSGSYITLSGNEQTIEFAVPGNVELSDLGIYISPEKSRLNVLEELPIFEKPAFKTLWFIILMILLLIAFFVVYIVLQEWYKRNYERSLFKNKDDLFNLINFVYNSRAAGLDDSEIRRKLSKSGWSGERLTYAFNKIDGKRTGMYEIPIFKSRENKEVREELQRRQEGALDARFIKRPNS